MKSKFLSAVAVLAVAACVAAADDKPKFFLEDGKVVERVAATESGLADLKKQVSVLEKQVKALRDANYLEKHPKAADQSVVIAESGPGELGAGPVTIPLKPAGWPGAKAAAVYAPTFYDLTVKALSGGPCVCGSTCTCAEGTCPGGCPTAPAQPIQYLQVCGPNGCRLVPVATATPTPCYAAGECPTGNCPTCPQAAPAFAPQPMTPAAAAAFTGRPALFPRAHGFFQAHRPHLFGRFFGGGCCGG